MGGTVCAAFDQRLFAENQYAVDVKAGVKDERLRCVVLIERFPGERWSGERARCYRYRIVFLVLVLKQLDLKRKVVPAEQKGKTLMKEGRSHRNTMSCKIMIENGYGRKCSRNVATKIRGTLVKVKMQDPISGGSWTWWRSNHQQSTGRNTSHLRGSASPHRRQRFVLRVVVARSQVWRPRGQGDRRP